MKKLLLTLAFLAFGSVALGQTPVTCTATIADKQYDATPNATISGYTLVGAALGDDVQCTGGTATFNDKNVGLNKPVLVSGITLTGADASKYTLSPTPTTEPLLYPSDLTWEGAFRLPPWAGDMNSFDYGGTALTYNPAHNSLFAVGHAWYQLTAEVTIPAVRTGPTVADLARATYVQPFVDLLQGHRTDVSAPTITTPMGGLLIDGNRLIATAYVYYDANGDQVLSHFVTGQVWANLTAPAGPYQLEEPSVRAMYPTMRQGGFVSDWMAPIPAEWRSALGGTALTGNGAVPIISRTSYGPSATVFTSSQLGVQNPLIVKRVMGYDANHTIPGVFSYGPPGELYNGAVTIGGMVFPDGTSSIIYFGRKPTHASNYCYGQGTSDPTLDRQPVPGTNGAVIYCYDPTSADKGTHGYPYVSFMYFYDVHDFIAAKNGTKNWWDVVPYATYEFNTPFQTTWSASKQIAGVTWDPGTRRIFLTVSYQDGGSPLVHVFHSVR